MDRYMYVCAWGGIVYDMLVLVLKEVSGALHGVYRLLVFDCLVLVCSRAHLHTQTNTTTRVRKDQVG